MAGERTQLGPGARRIAARFAEVACPPEVRTGNLIGKLLAEFDELLLGKAFFVVAGAPLAHSYFLIERYRPLTDASELASR